MPRQYTAYLLRRWILADGRERVELRLLPSGAVRAYDSLDEACAGIRGGAFGASLPRAGLTPEIGHHDDSRPPPPGAGPVEIYPEIHRHDATEDDATERGADDGRD